MFIGLFFFSSCNTRTNTINIIDKQVNSFKGQSVDKLGNRILIIYQDSQDNYWFGGDGLYKYDGKTIIQYSTKDGLCNNRIRGIQEDKYGHLYFDTGAGISKFKGQEFTTLVLNASAPKDDWKLNKDDLWFAGHWNKNGAYRYDGSQLYHLEFPKHHLEDKFYENNPNAGFNPYDVYTIFKDNQGHLWFGTSTLGACRYDGHSFQWISEGAMNELDDGPAPGVRSIMEDFDGHFWFSCDLKHRYHIDSVKTQNVIHDNWYDQLKGIETVKEYEFDDSVMSIIQDNEGHIWMANYEGGVWKYDGQHLTHYPVYIDQQEVLIFSIYKDNGGKIWLSTHNAGVLYFNGKEFETLPTIDNS